MGYFTANQDIVFGFIASLVFGAAGSFRTDLSRQVTWQAPFYMAPGTALASVIYDIFKYIKCKLKGEQFCLGLIKDGKLQRANILVFSVYVFSQVCINFAVNLTTITALMANVNVGLITSIWSTTPFFSAIVDYLLFGVKLNTSEIIGISFVIVSIAVLNMRSFASGEGNKQQEFVSDPISIGWPILCAILSPLVFTLAIMTIKRADKKHGMNPTMLSFNGQLVF